MDSLSISDYQQSCGFDQVHDIFEYFLEEQIFTDVSFLVSCGEKCIEFKAHKLILSMWSSVLADLCSKFDDKNDSLIQIEDISPTTFKEMLKFMYGFVPDLKRQDISFLMKLYEAALVYEVLPLQNFCNESIINLTPNENNAFQLLEAGKLLNCKSLVQRSFDILQDKTKEVLAAQELCNITPAMLMIILDLSAVSFISEYELVSWVLSWAENRALKNPGKKAFNEILDNFLPRLNFLKLTAVEFAKLYQNCKSGLMSQQDGFSVLMNIAVSGSHPLPHWYSKNPKQREYRKQVSNSSSYLVESLQSTHCENQDFQPLSYVDILNTSFVPKVTTSRYQEMNACITGDTSCNSLSVNTSTLSSTLNFHDLSVDTPISKEEQQIDSVDLLGSRLNPHKPNMNLNKPHMNLQKPDLNLNKPHMNPKRPDMNLNNPHMNPQKSDMNPQRPNMNSQRRDASIHWPHRNTQTFDTRQQWPDTRQQGSEKNPHWFEKNQQRSNMNPKVYNLFGAKKHVRNQNSQDPIWDPQENYFNPNDTSLNSQETNLRPRRCHFFAVKSRVKSKYVNKVKVRENENQNLFHNLKVNLKKYQ